jgi:hypothetical protein
MGIGVGLILVAIGAVLTFAVNTTVSGINIHTVGVILMVVGVVGVIIDLVIFAPRRRTVTTYDNTAVPAQDATTGRVTRVES